MTSKLAVEQCRQFADDYEAKAREAGISPKRSTVLRNIARGYSALASQLEILANVGCGPT